MSAESILLLLAAIVCFIIAIGIIAYEAAITGTVAYHTIVLFVVLIVIGVIIVIVRGRYVPA